MSKLTFRPRALDVAKPMPVYNSVELPDLSDYVAINRSTVQMPTGMEKEEESELHLQQAITAQQASSTGVQVAENVVIPTPKVVDCSGNVYDALYPENYERPKQFIKVQAALSVEPEVAEYDLDSEDERWLERTKKLMDVDIDQMEWIMDRLEKASEHQVAQLQEVKHLLQQMDDDVIMAVYDYWLDKRHRNNATPLIPRVKGEKKDGATGKNPYVAFRRRAEKMQTRKNRKNDEDSYERILKLSQDLRKAVTLFDMIRRREKTKREIICMDMEILENRCRLEDWQNQIYKDIQSRYKPVFAFGSTKEEFLRNSLKRKREYRKQRRQLLKEEKVVDSGLASTDWLLQKVEEWHRPASFPSCSFRNSNSVRKGAGRSTDGGIDSNLLDRLLVDRISYGKDSEGTGLVSSMDEDCFLYSSNAPECSDSCSSEIVDTSLLTDRSSSVNNSSSSLSINDTGSQNAPSHDRIMKFRPCSPVSTNELSAVPAGLSGRWAEVEGKPELSSQLSGLMIESLSSRLLSSSDEEKHILPMAVIKEEDGSLNKCLPVDMGVSDSEYHWHCDQLTKASSKNYVTPVAKFVDYGPNRHEVDDKEMLGVAPSAADNRFYPNHAAILYARSNGSRTTTTSPYSTQKRATNKIPSHNSSISARFSPVENEMLDYQGIGSAPSAAVLDLNYPLPTPSPSPTSAKLTGNRLGENAKDMIPASGLIDSNLNKAVVSPITSTVVPIAISPPEETSYSALNLKLRDSNGPHVTSNGEIEVKTTHPRHQQIARPVR